MLGFLKIDPTTLKLVIIMFGILIFFSTLFLVWQKINPKPFLKEMLERTRSWWIIVFLFLAFFCIDLRLGQIGITLLGLLALKEFLEKIPSEQVPANIKTFCYGFAFLQFFAAIYGGIAATLFIVPVAFFIIVTIWTLLFEKNSLLMTVPGFCMWILLLTVFGLSHLVLLLTKPELFKWTGSLQGLFLYYLFVTQFNDVLQFLWGKLFGKRPIAPTISPKKTWEGFWGAAFTTLFIAVLLRDLTPFTTFQSAVVGFSLAVTGYFGDLTLSTVKRNLHLKDMGNAIPGHGGILDRIDSLTLSSLTFFYQLYFWYGHWRWDI